MDDRETITNELYDATGTLVGVEEVDVPIIPADPRDAAIANLQAEVAVLKDQMAQLAGTESD